MLARKITLLFLSVSLLLSAGCTRNMTLVAKDLKYPASVTKGFYDNKLSPMVKDDYKVVQHFSFTVRNWGMLSGAIPLSPTTKDISAELNDIIKKYGGDGIANLSFTANDPSFLLPIGNLNNFPGLNLIPSYLPTDVSGDVIKFR